MSPSVRLVLRLAAVAALAFATGCAPKIGSSCTQPTDCSSQGDRVCDTAQPGGYCTILDCLGSAGGACPDNAVCVEFDVSVPGCPYDDYSAPARTGKSMCMEQCGSNSDCRDGYVCADPTGSPWNAAILDNNQSQSVCIAPVPSQVDGGGSVQDGSVEGSVCTRSLPELPDAWMPTLAAPALDGSDDAPAEAAVADGSAGD